MSREAAPLCTAKHAGCGGTPTIHTPALHCNRTCAASLQPSSTAFLLPVCLPVYLPPHCLHAWRPPPAETLWHPSTGCKMPHQGPCEASDIYRGRQRPMKHRKQRVIGSRRWHGKRQCGCIVLLKASLSCPWPACGGPSHEAALSTLAPCRSGQTRREVVWGGRGVE